MIFSNISVIMLHAALQWPNCHRGGAWSPWDGGQARSHQVDRESFFFPSFFFRPGDQIAPRYWP